MNSLTQKVAISIAVVALYTVIPFLSGEPQTSPGWFRQLLLGAPLSAWLVVLLLFLFPAIAFALARLDASASESANDAPASKGKGAR